MITKVSYTEIECSLRRLSISDRIRLDRVSSTYTYVVELVWTFFPFLFSGTLSFCRHLIQHARDPDGKEEAAAAAATAASQPGPSWQGLSFSLTFFSSSPLASYLIFFFHPPLNHFFRTPIFYWFVGESNRGGKKIERAARQQGIEVKWNERKSTYFR